MPFNLEKNTVSSTPLNAADKPGRTNTTGLSWLIGIILLFESRKDLWLYRFMDVQIYNLYNTIIVFYIAPYST